MAPARSSSGTASPQRLAVLGDVHANLPALTAVLTAIDAIGLTDGIVTGDLVMRGDHPEECVRALAGRRWPAVAGNTDLKAAVQPPRPPAHPASARVGSRSWTARRLSDQSLDYLRGLPLTQRVMLGDRTVLVMHGSPESPNRSLFDPLSTEAELAALVGRFRVDAIVCGHTHIAMAVRVAGCLFVNPGSVGESLTDACRPSWAWLQATDDGLEAHLEVVEDPLARMRVPRGGHRES